jgi:hypothetical protein
MTTAAAQTNQPAKSAPATLPPQGQRTPAPPRALGVKSGRIREGRKIVIYGPPGVGKSTLVASAPDIIVNDVEGSTADLDVSRLMYRDEAGGHIPRNLQEWRDGIRQLRDADHAFKRVSIDSVSKLDELIKAAVCQRGGFATISDDFGRAGDAYVDEWSACLSLLDDLRMRRGMDIILVGHSAVRKHKNPGADDYDRYSIELDKRSAPLPIKWGDEVGFLHFHEGVVKTSKFAPAKGKLLSKARILEFDRTAAWDAKARLPLPPTVNVGIENPWGPIQAAIDRAHAATPAEIYELITEQLERLNDEALTAKVEAACEGQPAPVLAKYLHELRRRDPEPAASDGDAR